MDLLIGQTYEVSHQRKGKFNLKVKSQDGDWVTGIITSGTANAICEYNVVESGEEITIRKSMCFFKKL